MPENQRSGTPVGRLLDRKANRSYGKLRCADQKRLTKCFPSRLQLLSRQARSAYRDRGRPMEAVGDRHSDTLLVPDRPT